MPLSSKPNSLNKTRQSHFRRLFSCCDRHGLHTPHGSLSLSSSAHCTAHVVKCTTMKDGQESCLCRVNFQSCHSNLRQNNIFLIHHRVLNHKSNACSKQYALQPKQVEHNVIWMTWREGEVVLYLWSWLRKDDKHMLWNVPIHFLSAFLSSLYPPHLVESKREKFSSEWPEATRAP